MSRNKQRGGGGGGGSGGGGSTSSEDDSDDDFVKQFAGRSVFAKRPKVDTPNLTQSSVDTEPAPMSLEAIEEQAQKVLQGMQFPIVQRICSLQDVGWRKSHGKRGNWIYPCIRLPQDEARLMFPKLVESKLPIRYLGWRWKDATAWEQVQPSTFYPLVGLETTTTTVSDGGDSGKQQQQQQQPPPKSQDEDYLQQFLDQECGTTPSVARRVEELVIRGCWSKVQENQQKTQDKQRQEKEILEQLVAIPKSQPETSSSLSAVSAKDHQDKNNTDHDDNDENDVDDDNNDSMDDVLLSPHSKRKRVVLRPGDVITYYLPGRVFGNPDVLCQSKILGITPKGSFPLNLESGDFLDPDQKIKRLAKIYKGKLVPDSEGVFRAVQEFSLRTAGTKELIGFHTKVRQITQSRHDYSQSMDDFWQQEKETVVAATSPKEGGGTETTTKKSDDESHATTDTSHKPSIPCPAYRTLLQQLKQVESDMKTKRRYVPRITPDELRLILQAWTLLEQQLEPPMREDQAIQTLVETLGISEMRIQALLAGDPHQKLSEASKLEILKELEQWMNKQGSKGANK